MGAHQREIDGAAPATVSRKFAALPSLFKHLVRHNHVEKNPVSDSTAWHQPRGKAFHLADRGAVVIDFGYLDS